MEKTFEITSLDAMRKLATSISEFLKPGTVIGLKGDLGAGKTTFTQFMGRAMGIDVPINSPTFTLMKVYEHTLPLYHIDAYRLEGLDTLDDEELIEYVDGEGVCVIEWYENVLSIMPGDFLAIDIEYLSDSKRRITMKGTGPYESILHNIAY